MFGKKRKTKEIVLKDGSVTKDRRLDRVYQEDWRSLNFLMKAPRGTRRALRSYTWSCTSYNDQGQEGACVGFGWGHELCAIPNVNKVDEAASRRIYKMAQEVDEWPGNAYEGTSVLAGAKVLHKLGYMERYYWGITLEDWVWGVGYGKGPCVVGLNWYEGMFEPDSSGYIHATGEVMGGHCVLVRGVTLIFKSNSKPKNIANVDLDKSSFLIHNSWGPSWGKNGCARISLRDAEKLLNENGDVCFPVNRKTIKV